MIYLDHNATTPVLPAVVEAMMPYLHEQWGNPSSTYHFGAKLKRPLEVAREQIAEFLGAHPMDIIFTSGGTESNNAALHAIARTHPEKRHIVTCAAEHSAVLSYCRDLESHGYQITYLPVNREGLVSLADLENAITPGTAGVSLMWANNETGVLFPIEEISSHCQSRGILFHCDAVQAAGKVPIDLKAVPIDYLAITGHKFGAPKGIGALYVRPKAPFSPFAHGGHQERGRRGGTENVPLIVGFGTAAALGCRGLFDYDRFVRPLRDTLETGLISTIPEAALNGHPAQRLGNTTNLHFPGIDSQALLLLLDQGDLCASSGSACLADSPDPSHVIAAMKPGSAAQESLRFSLGVTNTMAEIIETIEVVRRLSSSLASVR